MLTLFEHAAALAGQFPWLMDLEPDLDTLLKREIDIWVKADKADYNPFLLEESLEELSKLLDRCLAYRREYNDLVAGAVRQALDYDLFLKQADILEQMEKMPWLAELRSLDAENQHGAQQEFSGDAGSALARGFAALAGGNEALSVKAATSETTRQELVQRKWEHARAHQEQLQARHTSPGHPLNFRDRAQRVLALLLDDFADALSRAAAIAKGAYLLDLTLAQTYLDAPDPLDTLLWWTRRLIAGVRYRTSSERQTEIIVSVRRAAGNLPAVGWSTIASPAMPGLWQFGMFPRLRSIGLSMALTNIGTEVDPRLIRATFRLSMSARLPSTADRLITINCSDVGVNVPGGAVSYHSGQDIYNVSDFGGVTLLALELSTSNDAIALDWSKVQDVFIHLNFVSCPERISVPGFKDAVPAPPPGPGVPHGPPGQIPPIKD